MITDRQTRTVTGNTPKDLLRHMAIPGLHYQSDVMPGLRRQRAGKGFVYRDAQGRVVRDPEVLRRIRSLAIPPAWSDVWICPDALGHLQATGRDDRGRKQYRYHPQWSCQRNADKFQTLLGFARALPQLRERVRADLARPGLPREKVLAVVVRLLETTLIRVGNDEYARENQSFGLTTMLDEHVAIEGSIIRFNFRGKSGVWHDIALHDRQLARIVKCCRDLPGYELFQFVDENGGGQSLGSADVNAYLYEATGEHYTAKDFRTWGGTALAAVLLEQAGSPAKASEAKKKIVQVVKDVARQLGNRPATCRNYYIHPAVFEAYLDGTLHATFDRHDRPERCKSPQCLWREEEAVIEILEVALHMNGSQSSLLQRARGDPGARARRRPHALGTKGAAR